MFLFKKIVGPFFLPLSVCLEILILGLVLLWFTQKKISGKIIASIGVTLLMLLSYDALPNLLLRPLEYQYPPLVKLKDLPEVRWIVVLGGGHTTDPKIPMNSQLSEISLARLVEGVRLHNSISGSKLILSGGPVSDPEAKIMADVAMALGVDRQNLILESVSKDTEQQARLIQKIVGANPLVLVTSASHIPRSIGLFRKIGMQAIPAPTDYRVKERHGKEIDLGIFFPKSSRLENVEIAVHEYLGLAWEKLSGRI